MNNQFKQNLFLLGILFFFGMSVNSMEEVIKKEETQKVKSGGRVVIDRELKTQVIYNDNDGEVKIIIRDPNSKVKEIKFYTLLNVENFKQKIVEFFKRIPELPQVFFDKKYYFGYELQSSLFDVKNLQDPNKQQINFKNELKPNSISFHGSFLKTQEIKIKRTGSYSRDNIEDYEKNSEKELLTFNSAVFKKYKNERTFHFASVQAHYLSTLLSEESSTIATLEIMDQKFEELTSQGVNREILFKYIPSEVLIIPESEMMEIIENIVKNHDFSLNINHLQEIQNKINNYKDKSIGQKPLSEQLSIGNFPIDRVLLNNLKKLLENDQLESTQLLNLVNTAISLDPENISTGKFRSQTENFDKINSNFLYLVKLIDKKIALFIESDIMGVYGNDDHLANFFEELNKINPNLKTFIEKNNISIPYYFAKHILNNKKNLIIDTHIRSFVVSLLKKINQKDVDPLDLSKNLIQFANDYLPKLLSFDLQDKLKSTQNQKQRCTILEEYLTVIDKADRKIFTQENIDQNIGAMALGEGLLFDFSILTNNIDTCFNLRDFLYDQKKELDHSLTTVELDFDPNCTIINDMAFLLDEISTHTKLLDEIQSKK